MNQNTTPPDLRDTYLAAMIAGNERVADKVIEQALANGVTPQQIYLDIFQPTAYEIGRLWQINQIGVGHEHRVTAIIERQMGELHPLFRPQSSNGRQVLLACAPDEWHRIGLRMVADFFEAAGWEVNYLGASAPIAAIADAMRTSNAELVGISATMLFNLPHVTQLVHELEAGGLSGIPLMVGGLPFVRQPHLHEALSVQFSAPDATAAVQLASEPLRPGATPPAAASAAALAALQARRRQIIESALEAALQAQSDTALLGEQAPAVISAGFAFVTRMLEAALVAGQPELLDEQLRWGNARQPHDGVPPEHLLHRLEIYDAVLQRQLPPDAARIVAGYTQRMITLQRTMLEVV